MANGRGRGVARQKESGLIQRATADALAGIAAAVTQRAARAERDTPMLL